MSMENSIVAVHGIGAHPYYSWQFSERISTASQDGGHETMLKREVHWLKDEEMLPQACPDSRVMTFGYESQWFGDGAIKQKLSSVADGLLKALRSERRVWMITSSSLRIILSLCAIEMPLAAIDFYWSLLRWAGHPEGALCLSPCLTQILKPLGPTRC